METIDNLKITLQEAKDLVIFIEEQIKELQKAKAEKQKKLQAEKIQEINKNKAKLQLKKIRKYKKKYESGLYSIKKIASITKKSSKTIGKIVKNEKWNGQANLQKKNQNIYQAQKQQVKPLKPYKEVNQFKKKIEYEPIEWSDEIAPEIKIKRKVKKEKFDPLKYAEELMQEAEKNSISVKGKKCKRCGGFLAAFGEEHNNCRKNT